MKFSHILKVFQRDIKSIMKNPIALIIVLGVCVIPSLYAWVNIIASWNVYGNTGEIAVAVINNDQTAMFEDKQINIGNDVVKELKKNHNIKWTFVNTNQGNMGLIDGTYYALIEIPKDFSNDFLSVLSSHPKKPHIIYKVDTKVNPVAIKITDSAKNTLVQQIKSNFVSTVNETIFASLNSVGHDADQNKENLIELKDAIVGLNRNMDVIQASLDGFHSNTVNLNQFVKEISALTPAIDASLKVIESNNLDKQQVLKSTRGILDDAMNDLEGNLQTAQSANHQINDLVSSLTASSQKVRETKLHTVLPEVRVQLDALNNAISANIEYLESLKKVDNNSEINSAVTDLNNVRTTIQETRVSLQKLNSNLDQLQNQVGSMSTTVNQQINNTEHAVNQLEKGLVAVSEQLKGINAVLNDAKITQLIQQLETLHDNNANIVSALEALRSAAGSAPSNIGTAKTTIKTAIAQLDKALRLIDKAAPMLQNMQSDVSERNRHLSEMIASLSKLQPYLKDQSSQLYAIEKQLDASSKSTKVAMDSLNTLAHNLTTDLNESLRYYNSNIRSDVHEINDQLLIATQDSYALIESAKALNRQLTLTLNVAKTSGALKADFSKELIDKLNQVKGLVNTVGGKLEMVNNNDLSLLIAILQSNPEFMGDFMSNPFELKTEAINAIPNYGSSMAPIYTTLAMWVGCLLLNSMFKATAGYFPGVEHYTAREKHFGKLLFFCTLAILQGLIASVGDIWLLGVYVVNKPLFIAFAVVSSCVFATITFSLMSTFGNVGKALAIVYMILQLAGSGGTYPIQVDPLIFRILQPLFPFTYTVGGLREAVAGPLAISVILDFIALFVFWVITVVTGYFLVERLHPIVKLFDKKLKASGIGE